MESASGTGPSAPAGIGAHGLSFAPAVLPRSVSTTPSSGYAPPQVGSSWKAGRFWGQDFALQPDGTLRCPAEQTLIAQERRWEADGSLRVVYAESRRSCRPCPLREHGQWNGSATAKPRQVRVLLHPLRVGPDPLRLRGTGVGGSTAGPVFRCATSGSKSSLSRLSQ